MNDVEADFSRHADTLVFITRQATVAVRAHNAVSTARLVQPTLHNITVVIITTTTTNIINSNKVKVDSLNFMQRLCSHVDRQKKTKFHRRKACVL